MLIYIDKTVGEHISESALSADEVAFFTTLALKNREGQHIIRGDSGSLTALSKYERLGEAAGAIYSLSEQKRLDTISLVNAVQRLIALTYGKCVDAPNYISAKAIPLHINDAMQYRLSDPCCLVVENLDDCAFFSCIGARYRMDNRIRGITFSFQNDTGGGDTTHKTLKERVQKDKRLTLCIADSDIKYAPTPDYPDQPLAGETAKKLCLVEQELRKDPHCVPFCLYCLPLHEIENLIPLASLERIKSTVPTIEEGLKVLHALNNGKQGQAILYYDFKKNFSKLKDPAAKAYWESVFDALDNASKTPGQYKYPALCEKILQHAITDLQDSNILASTELDDYLAPLWNELGAEIFTWGCSSGKVVAT